MGFKSSTWVFECIVAKPTWLSKSMSLVGKRTRWFPFTNALILAEERRERYYLFILPYVCLQRSKSHFAPCSLLPGMYVQGCSPSYGGGRSQFISQTTASPLAPICLLKVPTLNIGLFSIELSNYFFFPQLTAQSYAV